MISDADSGSGSLRGALGSAVAGDTIKFAPSAFGTIKLTSGPLEVATNVSIDGPGADKITIDGNKTFQDLLFARNHPLPQRESHGLRRDGAVLRLQIHGLRRRLPLRLLP